MEFNTPSAQHIGILHQKRECISIDQIFRCRIATARVASKKSRSTNGELYCILLYILELLGQEFLAQIIHFHISVRNKQHLIVNSSEMFA